MTQKDLLLWVVAGVALVLSVIAIVAPRGQQSDAAYSNRSLTSTTVQNAPTVLSITVDGRDVTTDEYNTCHDRKTIADFERCVRSVRALLDDES